MFSLNIIYHLYETDDTGRKQIGEQICVLSKEDYSTIWIDFDEVNKGLKKMDLPSKTILETTNYRFRQYLGDDRLLIAESNNMFIYNYATKTIESEIFYLGGWVRECTLDEQTNTVYIGCDNGIIYTLKEGTLQKFNVGGAGMIKMDLYNNQLWSLNKGNILQVFDLQTNEKLINYYFITGKDNNLMMVGITPENYYFINKNGFGNFHFTGLDRKLYMPEQFDLKFNRPDLVMDKIGLTNKKVIQAYKKAYEKRLSKSGITEEMLSGEFHIPEVTIIGKESIKRSTQDEFIQLSFIAKDSTTKLFRANIWVNEVPIYGQNGIDLSKLDVSAIEKTIDIELSQGKNIIQVSVQNSAGAESLKETIEIEKENSNIKPNLYIVGIGIKNYQDSSMNLKYSDKDIRDFVALYKENKYFNQVLVDTLLNSSATLENLKTIKEKLLQSSINDHVIFMYSGHGLLDKELNYYLSSYNVDFSQPELNGIPYSEVDNLLDGIPARQKLVLIDACHSGEVDKDETKISETPSSSEIAQKTFDHKGSLFSVIGLGTSFELMKELFADIRRGTGAIVISSSSGKYFSFEDDIFQNGVFTYALKEILKDSVDNNNVLTVTELNKQLFQKVSDLTDNEQTPTVRNENQIQNFRVW